MQIGVVANPAEESPRGQKISLHGGCPAAQKAAGESDVQPVLTPRPRRKSDLLPRKVLLWEQADR